MLHLPSGPRLGPRRSMVCSTTASSRDYLLFINHPSRVFETLDHVIPRQPWIARDNAIHRVAPGNHPEDISHHNTRAANHRLPRANRRTDLDTIHVPTLYHQRPVAPIRLLRNRHPTEPILHRLPRDPPNPLAQPRIPTQTAHPPTEPLH